MVARRKAGVLILEENGASASRTSQHSAALRLALFPPRLLLLPGRLAANAVPRQEHGDEERGGRRRGQEHAGIVVADGHLLIPAVTGVCQRSDPHSHLQVGAENLRSQVLPILLFCLHLDLRLGCGGGRLGL